MATVPPPLALPQPPQPVPLPIGPRMYLEYYNDAANDPWNGVYAGLMAQYEAIAANTPEALLTRMLLAYGPSTPQAFVMLAAGPDLVLLGHMTLMHRLS
jgi:hypothetical protein